MKTSPRSSPLPIKALAFDVFGTVVDWRTSIIREGEQWGRARGLQIDWADFADRWRTGYEPAMDQVRRGLLPWMTIDQLHRRALDSLLTEFNITGLSEAEKDHWNRVWHRLHPWPDSVEGLNRLKENFVIATLSNGNVSLLIEMAKFARLPWDMVLSAELFRHYKPDPETYRGSAELLGYPPHELMLVAAHPYDLKAARDCGWKTAYVHRPQEYGPKHPPMAVKEGEFDVMANDFIDLARQLEPLQPA